MTISYVSLMGGEEPQSHGMAQGVGSGRHGPHKGTTQDRCVKGNTAVSTRLELPFIEQKVDSNNHTSFSVAFVSG